MNQPNYQLELHATIRQTEGIFGHGGLEVRETVNLNAASFLELAGILAKFHELAEMLRVKK